MLGQIAYALPFLAQGFAVTLWVSLLVVVLSLVAVKSAPLGRDLEKGELYKLPLAGSRLEAGDISTHIVSFATNGNALSDVRLPTRSTHRLHAGPRTRRLATTPPRLWRDR